MAFKNAISWFEIPTTDLERATKFYETIFETSLIPLELQNLRMRMFPIENQMADVGGALCYNKEFYKPSSTDGPLIYLNGNPDLPNILVPKTQISPEYGYMAVFVDTEGNRIALHSIPQQ